MEKPKKFEELVKILNQNVKRSEEYKKKYNTNKPIIRPQIDLNIVMRKNYPIKSYLIPSERKIHTNFEEMLNKYNETNILKSKELEDIILELKEVYDYFKQKLITLKNEIENRNKLYVYRFEKTRKIIQIYKVFESETDIIYYFIEYIQIQIPHEYQREMYNEKLEIAKKIIKLRKDDENNVFYRDPNLENIKIFEGEEKEKLYKEKSINNTIIKTLSDDFEIKKDCHLIKNDLLNFIPQLELNFDENIQMTEELFKELNEQLKEIIEEDNFSIVGVNRGSLHILISLQFLFKNLYIQTKNDIKSFWEKCKASKYYCK